KNFVNGNNIIFHYVRLPKNTGSSGGFYEGVKRAYEKGYDWLWLTDDDGIPFNNCLENQIPDSIDVISGPIVIDDKNRETWDYSHFSEKGGRWYTKIYELFKIPYKTIPFNGFLVSREVVEKIGFPKSEFFIQCDDVEYSWRAIKNGYKLRIYKNAKFFHPRAISHKPENVSEKTLYYYVRNNLIIARNYDFLLIRTMKRLIDMLLLAFKVNRNKKRIIFKAILDGLLIKTR
ncbi:MAG: glycosyltransferase, partial [Elusimicrobiota bacterium]|nr:glycosyltransferase [Endomicrobiia bacterium]MDW8166664.1 glycosyltransferase [Elusimicrobiota bacterium]